MKRFLATMLTLLFLLSALISCGGGSEESASSADSPSSVASGKVSESALPSSPEKSPSFADASSSLSEVSASHGSSPSEKTPSGENTSSVPSSSPVPSGESSPSTSFEQPEELPSAATLVGSKHLPGIIENQGGIGCCSSESVTYAQFTNAVSRYINNLDPNSNWDPSSGDKNYLFSAKYTYNFSGAGTGYAYEVLKTMGCLPMSVCDFQRSGGGGKFLGGSVLTAQKSRAWEITKEGQMLSALNFRIKNYEEKEFTSYNSGKLTTNEEGLKLLNQVKDAVNRGNAVVICGWSSYWQTATINKTGTLGKARDQIIWNGYKNTESTSDGNHAVTIVGYDDDITVTVNGVTQKGAFQVMNSWGQWANNGFIWMTYDSCNTVSEYTLYNNPYYYQNVYALSVSSAKGSLPRYVGGADSDLNCLFTPVSKLTLNEKEYDVYTIGNTTGKSFYSYGDTGVLSMVPSRSVNENCYFALIPYKDVVSDPQKEFAGGYLLYAVNAPEGYRYLSLSASVKLVGDCEENDYTALAIDQSDKKEDGSFVGMVNCLKKTSDTEYSRTGTIYRFSFLYWDKDLVIGNPGLRVEIAVSMKDRENLSLSLSRTDKNGVTDIMMPEVTRCLHEDNSEPDLGQKPGETFSFSGILNPTEDEIGYFAFSFSSLMGFGNDYDYNDFLWGVNVKGIGITVKWIRLISPDGELLADIVPDEQAEPLVKLETHRYFFNFGEEPKSYFGSGSYRLKNVGEGKVLSPLGSAGMLFKWDSGKKEDEKKASFTITYDEERDSFRIWNYENKYLLDIFKTTVADGTVVKLNAESVSRNTQDWIITQNEDGYLRIALKNYPDYAFGFDGKDYVLSSTDTSDRFLWALEPTEASVITTVVTETENGITVSASKPKGYTEGEEVTLKAVQNGKVVTTVTGSLNDENKFVFDLDVEKGVYLFTVMYNGEEQGAQIIYTYD